MNNTYSIMYKPHNQSTGLLYESGLTKEQAEDRVEHYKSLFAHLSPRATLKNNAEMYVENSEKVKGSPIIDLDMEYYQGPAIISFFRYATTKWIAMQLLYEDQELGFWCPLATATVNPTIPPTQEEKDTTVLIKDYSENEGMIDTLIKNKVIEPILFGTISSGFVYLYKCRLTPKWIAIAKRQMQDRK